MQRIRQFINQYPPRALIRSLRFLLADLFVNGVTGSRIAVAAAVVPFALSLIVLLYFIITVKWVVTNFFTVIRSLLTICIVEVRLYWENLRTIGEVLAEELSEIIARIFQFISYLFVKIFDDDAVYRNQESQISVLGTLWKFIIWLFLALVSVLMSALLIVTFFTGLPLLHQYLRIFLMGDTDRSNDKV